MTPSAHHTACHARKLSLLVFVPLLSCTVKEPQPTTYFDQHIAPILSTACARGPTGAGCHVSDPRGNAFGNLDLSTFAGVNRRRDLLATYGPYQQPTLLMKVLPPESLQMIAFDGMATPVTGDIRHTGGPVLTPDSPSYDALRRWIFNGASENNAGAPPPPASVGPCSSDVPSADGFDPTATPTSPDYAVFLREALPVLKARCAAASCHGSPFNSLRLLCGEAPEQVRWDYFVASGYLGASGEQSELVRRPLRSEEGGSFHEGGPVFESIDDPGYASLVDWATSHGPPAAGNLTAGFVYFAHRVQPALARKGCMMLHCHSTSSANDLRLSGGSAGSYSLASTQRNYGLALAQLALESDDPGTSRLVRKNLYRPEVFPGGTGIAHRGGPLLEDFGPVKASGDLCDQRQPPYDLDNEAIDDIPVYCVVREWLKRERSSRTLAPLTAIAYVRRPVTAAPDRLQDFDGYSPGAELHIVQVAPGQTGVFSPGQDVVANTLCGLDLKTADIRRPAVSWDGSRVAFGARTSASDPLAIYEMNVDGTSCVKNADIAAHPGTANGLLIHDFDPAYSPPEADGSTHLVFTSTRGNAPMPAVDYSGPQRTPADPGKPNSNLFSYEADPNRPGQMRIRQLTYLLDMERTPAFMSDGRVIFTVEKREPGFYELALRRINVDGGDFHPLYGQRSSIGFHEVSQVVQLADKNFAAIFSDPGIPHRGGALGIFNRSIGVDFTSTDPSDYLVDPSVLDAAAPTSPEPAFFLHSLRFPDPSATGRAHGATAGVYASPSPLPDGRVLVSFGAASDSSAFDGDYDLFVLDPATGTKSKFLGDAAVSEEDAVPIYARALRTVYSSAPGEPNTSSLDESKAWAEVTMQDVPVLASLIFQNTPTGRTREQLPGFEVWEELPPPLDVATFAQAGMFAVSDGFGQVYVRRRILGKVPVLSDGSARWFAPGGVPLVLHLLDSPESRRAGLPRWQREEIVFAPGESEHEALPPTSFDGFCGQCHGSVSGRPLDVAMRPDVLVGASATLAPSSAAVDLRIAPAARGPVRAPPFTP